jgi:hypothetical protein
MRLKYLVVESMAVVDAGEARLDTDWWLGWMYNMINSQEEKEIIFFFTVETTDIFNEAGRSINLDNVAGYLWRPRIDGDAKTIHPSEITIMLKER